MEFIIDWDKTRISLVPPFSFAIKRTHFADVFFVLSKEEYVFHFVKV